MGAGRQFRIRQQRGVSLTGIIFVLIVAGSLLVLGMRLVPALVEYQSIRNAVAQAKATNGSPAEMRRAFDQNANVNDIEAIRGKDLDITRNGDHSDIAFEYEKRIHLAGNATLLLTFSGNTDPSAMLGKTAGGDKSAADK